MWKERITLHVLIVQQTLWTSTGDNVLWSCFGTIFEALMRQKQAASCSLDICCNSCRLTCCSAFRSSVCHVAWMLGFQTLIPECVCHCGWPKGSGVQRRVDNWYCRTLTSRQWPCTVLAFGDAQRAGLLSGAHQRMLIPATHQAQIPLTNRNIALPSKTPSNLLELCLSMPFVNWRCRLRRHFSILPGQWRRGI